jgi:hypothetical protein
LIQLAAVFLGLTAVLVGMVLGYAVALLIATSPFVARHKTVLGGVAVLVAMGGYLFVTLPQFGGVGQEALAVLPVGWLVDRYRSGRKNVKKCVQRRLLRIVLRAKLGLFRRCS